MVLIFMHKTCKHESCHLIHFLDHLMHQSRTTAKRANFLSHLFPFTQQKYIKKGTHMQVEKEALQIRTYLMPSK